MIEEKRREEKRSVTLNDELVCGANLKELDSYIYINIATGTAIECGILWVGVHGYKIMCYLMQKRTGQWPMAMFCSFST